jgi:UDP-N-acetylglucosamine 2-epimerase (non-hydrolysing)
MKIAPIIAAIQAAQQRGASVQYRLVHTGQHYDRKMSGAFFEQLHIPEPDVNLEAGGGTHAEQTANIMVRFEPYLLANPCDVVVVVGDVNSTLACSIVAKKLHIKVAHVEAGIRSGDWTMPEEINRIVTDSISDYFFTTSELANQTLLKNGASPDQIFFVGNTMIDTLLKNLPRLQQPTFWTDLNLQIGQYLVLTLHRPANVDEPTTLITLLKTIAEHSRGLPIVFPIHPRTAQVLKTVHFAAANLHIVEPMEYLAFIYLVKNARVVITDSGGITEETTVLGIPCMTLRNSTERPETVTMGTNELLGTNPAAIPPALEVLFENKWKTGTIPPLWDGNAAERIVEKLLELYAPQ